MSADTKVPAPSDTLDMEATEHTVHTATGNKLLIELGLKTGISLMFSLLRQCWYQSKTEQGYCLSNEVLMTARDLLSSLPPLSLAHDTKIPPLGTQTLAQVCIVDLDPWKCVYLSH